MAMHPAEDVVQHVDRLHHVRPLVEHHALRAVGHRRVGNLGARRQAVLRQALEHLRRPDHRHVRGFAQPQDLLLHFGQPLEATFDGEIATRDHHAAARRLHGFQQHRRKIVEAALGLDLEHDGGLPIAQRRQELLQRAHVLDRVDERERHHVGVRRDECQIRTVLVGHGGEVQVAVGQVDAFVGDQLRAAARACVMRMCRRSGSRSFDDASDAPIVDPHALARPARPRRPATRCSRSWPDSTRDRLDRRRPGGQGSSSRVRMSRSPVAKAIAALERREPRRCMLRRRFRRRRAGPQTDGPS